MKSSLISKNNLFTHTHTNSENLLPQSNLVFNETKAKAHFNRNKQMIQLEGEGG